jgi:hypothetical protein
MLASIRCRSGSSTFSARTSLAWAAAATRFLDEVAVAVAVDRAHRASVLYGPRSVDDEAGLAVDCRCTGDADQFGQRDRAGA